MARPTRLHAAARGAGPKDWGWSTIAEYVEALEKARPATTLVPSVAHSAVRERVIGGEARAPDRHELGLMGDEARKGFEAGARMLSFGLIYAPGLFAGTEELVALAAEAARITEHRAREGKVYCSIVLDVFSGGWSAGRSTRCRRQRW